MNVAILEFFFENVNLEEFENKRVIEVGSKYVNGSVRPFIESFLRPAEYIGVGLCPKNQISHFFLITPFCARSLPNPFP